jgi:hypothetical protein
VKRHNTFLVIFGILAMSNARAADEPTKPVPNPLTLVQKLGASTFGEREAAHKQLIAVGAKAKPAVLAGTKSTDPEIARRCVAILPHVRAAERKELVDGTGDWPPEGKRFKELVGGDSPAARKLFALMAGNDHRAALLDVITANPNAAGQHYASEVKRLYDMEVAALLDLPDRRRGPDNNEKYLTATRKAVGPGDVALVFYLGTFQVSEEAESAGSGRTLRTSFFDLVTGTLKEPSRKLFAAWLELRSDPKTVTDSLHAAFMAGITEALPIARRTLGDHKATGESAGAAALVLGKVGSNDDLVPLSASRDDPRMCWTTLNGHRNQYVEVRDVATAMSLLLRRQELKPFGFHSDRWGVWWAGSAGNPVVVSAFDSHEERDTTLKKAWAWLDKQPGAPKPINAKR